MSVDLQNDSENTGTHRKSKRKKNTLAVDAVVEPGDVERHDDADTKPKKDRKKRKRKGDDGAPEEGEGEVGDVIREKKKKRRKKDSEGVLDADGGESHPAQEPEQARSNVEEPNTKREKKKKKHKKTKDTDIDIDNTLKQADEVVKTKKKKKSKEGLPNPEGDESLDDQARKGEPTRSIHISWS